MRRILLLVMFVFAAQYVFCQGKVRTEGSAVVEWYIHESRLDVEKRVKELAIVDALERAFGRVVVQGNATYINNIQSGAKVETNSVFNMIANTSVKGELIKEIKCSYQELKGSRTLDGEKIDITDIKCDIIIQAREILTPPIRFSANTYSCLNDGCKTEVFKNDSYIYMKFNSPSSGYLSIFLDDGETTSRLLPYRDMPAEYESSVPVKADKEYTLFSRDMNVLPVDNNIVDEYNLYTESQQDLNRIFIIFCSQPIRKPGLSKTDEADGIELPYSLSSEKFQSWMNKSRAFFKQNMQVGIIDIQITR